MNSGAKYSKQSIYTNIGDRCDNEALNSFARAIKFYDNEIPVFINVTYNKRQEDINLLFGYFAFVVEQEEHKYKSSTRRESDISNILIPAISHIEIGFDVMIDYFTQNLINLNKEEYQANVKKFEVEDYNYFYEVSIKRKIEKMLDEI